MLRWRIAILISAAIAISYLDRQTLPIAIGAIKADIPISNQVKAVLDSAFLVTYGLMYLGGGRLMDVLGTRRGFTIIMVFWSLACASHGFATNVILLAASRLLLGIGEGGGFPAATRAIAEWFPAKERSTAMGIINAGTAVGAVIAPPLIASVILNFHWLQLSSWRWVFFITGAAGLLWTLWWVRAYFPPEEHPKLTATEREFIEATGDGMEAAAIAPSEPATFNIQHRTSNIELPIDPNALRDLGLESSMLNVESSSSAPRGPGFDASPKLKAKDSSAHSLAELLRFRETWGVMLAKFLSDAAWYFYLFWLPKYLLDARGFDIKGVGSVAWIPYAAAGIGCLGGGGLSSWMLHRGRSVNFARKFALATGAFVMPCAILIPHVSITWCIALFSLAFFGHQWWSTLVMILPTDLFPKRAIGTVAGLVGMSGAMGGVVLGQVAGYLLDHGFSYAPVLAIAGSLHVVAFLVICLALPTIRPLPMNR
jgi:MFS family permease